MAIALCACKQQAQESQYISVENGHFMRNGKPYYYVGTNFWYGAILGSEGPVSIHISEPTRQAENSYAVFCLKKKKKQKKKKKTTYKEQHSI